MSSSHRSTWLVAAVLGAVMFSLTACAGGPAQNPPGTVVADPIVYRLDARDKIRVTVFGEENLSGEFVVTDNGNVALPLIGEVPAKGHTLPELQTSIAATLAKGYVNDPRVSIEVLNFRPYYILGEVNKPGEYPYATNLTVLNAAAAAAGFTYRANMSRVLIRRANETYEREYPLTTTTPVGPGDTIRITERFF